MDRTTLKFKADEQRLIGGQALFASDTINYIEAEFELGENWSGYDSVRAVWHTNHDSISTVLNEAGHCVVPQEVLRREGKVEVNLVGSIASGNVLTDRLTTYPIVAIVVDAKAKIHSTETSPITPNQFEQFASIIHDDAVSAASSASDAATSASEAAASATRASNSAADATRRANQAYNYANAAERANKAAESARDSAQSYRDGALNAVQAASQAAGTAQTASSSANIYASRASESATNASQSASQAESAKNTILNMTVSAESLPEGSSATVVYEEGHMEFGIPKGDKGDRGNKGDTGETGATPQMSIGTVETLAPDEDASVTIRGTAEAPILDFGLPKGETGDKGDKGDTGEVSLADLASLMPLETVSGSVASFSDGSAVFDAEQAVVTLEPVQDLHGYDKPWIGGAGKNKANIDGATNLTGMALSNGVLANTLTDGRNRPALYVATYRGSTLVERIISVAYSPTVGRYSGRYTINNTDFDRIRIWHSGSTQDLSSFIPCSVSATGDYVLSINFLGVAPDVVGGFSFNEVQFEAGSTDTSYEPYSNICPISGHDSASVVVSGVNIWDEEWELGYYNLRTGEPAAGSVNIRSKNYIRVIPDTIYHVKNPTGSNMVMFYYDADKNFIRNDRGVLNQNITTPSNCQYIRFHMIATYGTTYNHDISINYPSTDTDYHPSQGVETYTTSLGRTVYGGTVDLVSGVLTVEKKLTEIASFSGTFGQRANGYCVFKDLGNRTLSQNSVSNMFVRSGATVDQMPLGSFQGSSGVNTTWSFILPSTITSLAEANAWLANLPETLVVTETLETPQTYQLTPQAIALLTGDNNVWSDGGSIEVKYRANIGLYVDKNNKRRNIQSFSV